MGMGSTQRLTVVHKATTTIGSRPRGYEHLPLDTNPHPDATTCRQRIAVVHEGTTGR